MQVRGADKLVRSESKLIPQRAPLRRHFGDKRGFRDPGFLCRALDIHAMLVCTGGHHHFVAAHALVAPDSIRNHSSVGVSNVRQAVRVIDRRGEIEFGFSR